MKKVLALTLVLMLSLSLLVACGGGGPAELTKETIVATWSGEMDMREALNFNVVISATFEFKADGNMVMTIDKDDLKSAVEEIFNDDDFLKENYGFSKEDLESAMALTGQTFDSLIDTAMAQVETTQTLPYTFDGTTLTIDGDQVDYTYASGVITMTMEGQTLKLTYKG